MLPPERSDIVARRFFDRCSNALSVVRLLEVSFSRPLSRSTFEVLATTCTGLRAFGVVFDDAMDLDGFNYLMKLRASQTRRLFKDAMLGLLPKYGQAIRYLVLDTYSCGESTPEPDSDENSHIIDNKVIKAIANFCPNLRGLECISDQKEELTKTREDAIARLLEKCGCLQVLNLDFREPLDKNQFSDPNLKAKLSSLEGRCGKGKYFHWQRYAAAAGRNGFLQT
ncbi:hypothetical protein HK102_004906 [Quaeritorhiza haematococci]|nr:hypothetical protein HK102_004906 [Quaeritorhiza haematococci]